MQRPSRVAGQPRLDLVLLVGSVLRANDSLDHLLARLTIDNGVDFLVLGNGAFNLVEKTDELLVPLGNDCEFFVK